MSGRVELELQTGAYQRELYTAVSRALHEGGAVMLAGIHASSGGYNIGPITGRSFLSGVEQTSKGQGIFAIVPDFRAIMFNFGTLGNRKRALHGGGSRRASWQTKRGTAVRHAEALTPGHGVRPVFFMTHALAAARAAMPELLAREIGRIRL